ncbi:MAG: hypothetical protein EP297_15260 [Gammaproteobacteria bacterium]|nr:MAG: hypothetical protein EP297_15260 [Gammaproteobacteria bacterium]
MNKAITTEHYNNEDTIPKTLWSETIIDILIDALHKGRPDDQIIPAIKSLYTRSFNTSHLIKKVNKELGEQYTTRLYALIKQIQSGHK